MGVEPEHVRPHRLAQIARIIALPLGVAAGVVGLIHLKTATEEPVGDKRARFQQGYTVYYNTPALLTWRNRLLGAAAVGAGAMLITGAVVIPIRLAAWRQRSRRQSSDGLPLVKEDASSAISPEGGGGTHPSPPVSKPATGSDRSARSTRQFRVLAFRVLAAMVVVGLVVAYHLYTRVPRGEQIRLGISAVQMGMTEQQVDAIMGGPPDERQKGNDAENVYELKVWRHGMSEGRVGFKNGKVDFRTSR